MTWTLDFPFHDAPVSSNQRIHWAKRSSETTKWKDATFWLCKEAQVPPLERASLVLHIVPPDKRRRDSDNFVAYLLKPIKDGLVLAKVVPDDTDEYITWRVVLGQPGSDVLSQMFPGWNYRAVIEEVR